MNDWYIRILLKNGCLLDGYVCSPHTASGKLVQALFAGDRDTLCSISPSKELDGKQILAFNRGEVAAYWLSTKPFYDAPLFRKEVKFD